MRHTDRIGARTHPIRVVRELRQRYGNDLILSFSRYYYKRRTREDVRESFRVPIQKVNKQWLLRQTKRLLLGQELALESRVRTEEGLRHIPMIDFYGMGQGQLIAIMDALPEYSAEEPLVYFSGRSFHAYFPILVRRVEWIKFMGSALLCNTPEHPRVVDQRWIGHRLIGGYAALRWSWNTERYRALPRKVRPTVLNSTAKTKVDHLVRR